MAKRGAEAKQSGVELAISASGRIPSIALRVGDEILIPSASEQPAGSRSGGSLTALIAGGFDEFSCSPHDLTSIRLDLGPGSYTGLRVAVTFARTMQRFQDVLVTTSTSLQLLTVAAVRNGLATVGDRVRPVLDARRRRFHHGLINADGARVLEAPRAVEADELLAAISKKEVVLAAPALHQLLEPTTTGRDATLHAAPTISARLLFDRDLTLTEARSEARSEALEPLYLMGSYAE